MIISASRRTDIPAFYSTWLMNRLKEGYVLIPGPRNPNRLGRVDLTPQNVDCIAFWTKNPAPMLGRLPELDIMGYNYYIQFTLTPYGTDSEPNLPPKADLLRTFIRMSEQIGALRSVWRYDPVMVDENHPIEWHLKRFSEMCEALRGYTERCVFSFVDPYKSLNDRYRALARDEMLAIAAGFSQIAGKCDIALFTCAEEIDLSEYGIGHSACVDRDLIERIIGCRIAAKKDANQRASCCCIESVDIGAYDTCPHGCAYCYATSSRNTVLRRIAQHDPLAPMLTGYPRGDETITDRTTPSQKINQLTLF